MNRLMNGSFIFTHAATGHGRWDLRSRRRWCGSRLGCWWGRKGLGTWFGGDLSWPCEGGSDPVSHLEYKPEEQGYEYECEDGGDEQAADDDRAEASVHFRARSGKEDERGHAADGGERAHEDGADSGSG